MHLGVCWQRDQGIEAEYLYNSTSQQKYLSQQL